MSSNHADLIDRDRSCLVIIDVQQHFLDKLPDDEPAPLVERIAWLTRVARSLEIPVVATAEATDENGPLVPELAGLLPPNTPVFNKVIFDLHAQEDIRAAIEATGRRCFILAGLETDVCVAHSALGLAGAGYRPVVIEDACAAPPPHHEQGLRRLRDTGVAVTSVRGIFYEWVRDLATITSLGSQGDATPPPGVTL